MAVIKKASFLGAVRFFFSYIPPITTPAARSGVLSRVTLNISHKTGTYFLSRGAIHAGLSNQAKVLLLGEGHAFFSAQSLALEVAPPLCGCQACCLLHLFLGNAGALAELLYENLWISGGHR